MIQRLRLTAVLLSAVLTVAVAAQAGTQKSAKSKSSHAVSKTSKHTGKSRHTASSRHSRKSVKPRGQQAMNPERVREIQSAMIRARYLDGEPNGVWDSRSKTAMQKFQADQGWQSKVVPDSRALIRLGLGPDHANLLNPETAAIQPVPGGGAATRNAPTPEQ